MKISDVVQTKGREVVTISPDATIAELLQLLAKHNIGAVVVSGGSAVDGIVSERDVVRHLNVAGAGLLDTQVQGIMTNSVHTCGLDDDLAEVAGLMTDKRVRHMPVLVDGRLAAIVSIGDLVKHRINQLTDERDQLESYIHQ